MSGHGRHVLIGTFLCILVTIPQTGTGREPYLEQFKSQYESKFPGNAEATKCSVCHPGPVKRNRNGYGQALAKVLSGKNVKDADEIRKALTKAEKMPSSIKGKTFGDLIKE